MKLEKILIADDREENRVAAKIAIPSADIVSSATEAIEYLDKTNYDLVITDMRMEKRDSGLAVIAKALETNAIAYVISHIGPAHYGAEQVMIKPYIGLICYKNGKANPKTWEDAITKITGEIQIENYTSNKSYQEVLLKLKENKELIQLPPSVLSAIYYI